MTSPRQLIVHLATALVEVRLAVLPVNSTAVGVTPPGMSNTTQPRSHCPADSPSPPDPNPDSLERDDTAGLPTRPSGVPAVEPLLRRMVKSDSSAPVGAPEEPAHSFASIA